MNGIFHRIDVARVSCGFLSVKDTLAALEGNHVLDPFSTLVSSGIEIGKDNILFPGVTLQVTNGAKFALGNKNIIHAGSLFEVTHGSIIVGSKNQFGEGGFTARANRPGARIDIGDSGRYLSNPSVFGETTLGSGTQILGNITVDGCVLEAGGSHEESNPDSRGGLLKGSGIARGLTIPKGMVIAGQGSFIQDQMLSQNHFHSKT